MRDKRAKYPGVDIAKISASINDAVKDLPKGHCWSNLFIEKTSDEFILGEGECLICNTSIMYVQLNLSLWLTTEGEDIAPCEEASMKNALE